MQFCYSLLHVLTRIRAGHAQRNPSTNAKNLTNLCETAPRASRLEPAPSGSPPQPLLPARQPSPQWRSRKPRAPRSTRKPAAREGSSRHPRPAKRPPRPARRHQSQFMNAAALSIYDHRHPESLQRAHLNDPYIWLRGRDLPVPTYPPEPIVRPRLRPLAPPQSSAPGNPAETTPTGTATPNSGGGKAPVDHRAAGPSTHPSAANGPRPQSQPRRVLKAIAAGRRLARRATGSLENTPRHSDGATPQTPSPASSSNSSTPSTSHS